MKAAKTFLKLFILMIFVYSCHRDLDDASNFIATDNPESNDSIDNKLWILKHRRYQDSGIFIYNETSALIELELELPKNLESPHAIAYDGESLWVGGIGENESIYQLNSQTGAILSEIANIRTEGIAVDENYLYYSVYETNTIKKIEKNGTFVEDISIKNASLSIPDISINNNNLYYLRYSEKEPVAKLNLDNKKENNITITESIGTYSLTIFNNEIVAITSFNEIIRFDLDGELISTQLTGIEGWVTAIASYYE